MRKIMLFMSLICLTALAAGCEDNNMVVLMCDGGVCPDGGGDVENKPVTGEGKPCNDPEDFKTCTDNNSYLYCKNGATAFQKCLPDQICENNKGCVGKVKPLCGAKDRCDGGSCECPEEQTCENGTCKPPKCEENDSCETCRCDAPLECNGDNKCLKPICTKDLECPQACNCPEGHVCKDGKCKLEGGDHPKPCGGQCAEDECFGGKCIDDNAEVKCKDYSTISRLVDGNWKDKKCDDRCVVDIYGHAVCMKESGCNDESVMARRCSSDNSGIRYCDGMGTWKSGGECEENTCLYKYNEINNISRVTCEKSQNLLIYKCNGDSVDFCVMNDSYCWKVYDCSRYNRRCDEESLQDGILCVE